MQRIKVPFAQNGDKTAIPDGITLDGSVNNTQGYTSRYDENPAPVEQGGSPTAKVVGRTDMNYILWKSEVNQKTWQEQTFPDWIEDDGEGVPFSYPKNAIVRATDGENYISLEANNTDNPIGNTKWEVFGDYAKINGDETKTFKVADAVELNEAVNKKQLYALQKSVNDAISNIQTLPIGAILNGYTIFDNCIVAFGGEFNRADYPKLWAYLQANPTLVKTQTQWQTEATANGGICGFFSDGNGMTTFRVPNLAKAFLRPDSRSIASYEKGTLYTYDTSNDQSVLGDTIWHSSTKRVGSNSQVDIGVDDFNISQYPNVGACGNSQSIEVGLPTSGARYFAGSTRPKNIAVLPLIVAK